MLYFQFVQSNLFYCGLKGQFDGRNGRTACDEFDLNSAANVVETLDNLVELIVEKPILAGIPTITATFDPKPYLSAKVWLSARNSKHMLD